MKQLLAAVIAATFALVSVSAIAAKHEGGMEKPKVDCKDKKNAKNKECAKKSDKK